MAEPPMDAAYRVIARSLRKPRVQKVTTELLGELVLEAKLAHGVLGHAIAHADKLLMDAGYWDERERERITPVDEIEALLRERRAVNAGIAKAALWIDGYTGGDYARKMLAEFNLTADDLRKADAVERIHHCGSDLEDAIALLEKD